MVAGRRTGKTSFLRLLLDTSHFSPTVTRDQLASIAKFVQGCSGHTSHIRTVSVDIDLALTENDKPQSLTLTLIDTPSLDFDDDTSTQKTVSEIIRHVDARFAESIDDERQALSGDHHVHLCIYFLDPDHIVPPSVPAPPVPPVPRARTNSLSHAEGEPFILEPPVTTNPALCRPTLPAADIATIRRLSARINVLPVVACADTLTNERLAAVKMAVRRDLAEAGIGFGIFDLDTFPQYPGSIKDAGELPAPKFPSDPVVGYTAHLDGAGSTATSPPSTPVSPSLLRLPFALISPDIYSHSDGVSRPPPSRYELALQYSPSNHHSENNSRPFSKIVPGRFVRSYRWGCLDVMDVNHCDFLHLRGAVFHHMQTLRKYTREYLFDKFRTEIQLQAPTSHHTLPSGTAPSSGSMCRPSALPQDSRPILAIDTAPSHSTSRRSSHSTSRAGALHNGEISSSSLLSAHPPSVMELSPRTATSSRSQRQRTKKITVACNFCRSRKLKCDGGRPACGQCFKRSNPCDYMVNHKRRGNNGRQRKQYAGSESDGEGLEDPSPEADGPSHPSHSPEVIPQPASRRSSNVSMLLTESLPSLSSAIKRQEDPRASAVLAPITHSATFLEVSASDQRTELPPIATLSIPSSSTMHDEAQSLTSLKTDTSSTRRRTSSAASGRSRTSNHHGSKIVACNICRARKTRCDGAHPTCGSCSRRSLPCNYVTDAPGSSRSRGKNTGTSTPGPSASTSARSSPTSQLHLISPRAASASNGYIRTIGAVDPAADFSPQPNKKMRMTTDMGVPAIAVLHAP
ncbi:hypothetical protein BKA93DRAFT_817544 [Sparassis latifolia]